MARGRKLHDRYFKAAKREGYLARSAYKLVEIDDRRRLLRPSDRVLDLGCAPGSWMQVAAERVGPHGVVVGADLSAVRPGLAENIRTIVADVTEIEPGRLIEIAGGLFDVVLSDMAPNTTGAGDHFRSVRLCERVLELATKLLRPGGSLVMKVFEGETYPDLLRRTAREFESAKGFKPKASRDVSSEIYVIGTGYHASALTGGDGEAGNRAPTASIQQERRR